METPTNSVDACSKKSKKPLIAGIVVAVVVLAGIGFWTWHNTPGFCGVCHTPMSTYVATYEAQPNAQATDKWGNDVTNSNAMLVVTHKEAGVECLSCHVPSINQQIGEVTETITGDYYYPLSEVSISALQENSGQNASDEAAFCLKSGCHVDASGTEISTREDLMKAAADKAFNPHSNHHGEANCSDCHKSHRASVMQCTQCHNDAAASMPEGWVDYKTGKQIAESAVK